MNKICVCNLEKVLTTMPIPVHKNPRFCVRLKPFRDRKVRFESASQHVHDGFRGYVLRLIVDLYIITHPVLVMVFLTIKRGWEYVPAITSVISRIHQNNVVVVNTFFF